MVGAIVMAAALSPLIAGDLPRLEDAKLDTFLTEVYGKRPVERPAELSFADLYPPETFERNPAKGPNRKIDAKRRILICRYRGPYGEGSFRFTVFLPKDAKGPVPAYVLICNRNPGRNIDPWRVEQTGFWPAEEIVGRGYAAIAFWNDEIAPDCYSSEYAFKAGVFRCFEDPSKPRAADAWGSLSAWAWGASRIMDWIETEPAIDAKHVAVVGHSRGGKTALIAGITDKRFAMAVSNGSGCGGAKLYRADLPESEHIHQVRKSVPYWFCGNYAKYENKDAELPFDQHQWLSLMAPRLLYVASGTQDRWAGPAGEKLATDLARPAWGERGDEDVGYHVREGKHDLTAYDWNKFMDFTDEHGWRKSAAVSARTARPLDKGWSGTVIDEEGRTNSLSCIDLPHNWDDYHGCRQLVHGDRHGVATYRRTFTAEFAEGQRSYLVFDGAGTYLSVTLNGVRICDRRMAGRLVTTVEATDAIKLGTNVLEVECAHPSDIMDCPWQCCGCGNRTCEAPEPFGLFRGVRLVVTGGARIVPWGLHVWHDGDCRTAFIETEIDFGKLAKESLTLHLLAPELGLDARLPCSSAADGKIRAEHPLKDVVRWSLENPKLYEVTGELVAADGTVVDSETVRTGFRSIRWPLAGGDDHRFFLNGEPVFIHGTAETDHRQGKSMAFEPEEIDVRCAEFRKLGFNLFREGHEPHDLRYLRRLEESGILFWAGFSTRQFTETDAFCSNYLAAVEQWIKERRNSPAIVIWGLQNESALPREFAEKCVEAIRRLDPMSGKSGRPVVSCNGGAGTDWNVIQNWSGTYSGYGGELLTYQVDLAKPYQLLNGEYGAWRLAGWRSDPDEPLNEKGPWTEEHQARILYEKLMRGWMAREKVCGQVLWTFFSHQNPGRSNQHIDEGYREIDKVGPINMKGLYTLAGRRVEAWYLYYAYGAHLRAGDLESVREKPLSWWLAEGHRLADGTVELPRLAPEAETGLVYIHRLNCGGDALIDSRGNKWTADDTRFVSSWAGDADLAIKGFTLNPALGSQGVVEGGVRNAAAGDQRLFGTYRYGRDRLRFEFPVPTNADCVVEMYFVEPGSYGRLFDVAIDGQIVERNFDLGCQPERCAARKSWRVRTDASGTLRISFPRVPVNQAVVSAVAIATDAASAAMLGKETRKPGYPECAGFTWAELGARVCHRTPATAKPKDVRPSTVKNPPVIAKPFEDKDGFHRALLTPVVSGDYSVRFRIVKGNPIGKTVEWRFETESWNDNTPSVVFKTGSCVITEAMVSGNFVVMPLSTFINAGGFFFGYRVEGDCLSARELKE